MASQIDLARGAAAIALAIVIGLALKDAAAARSGSALERRVPSATDIPGDVADDANAPINPNGKCDVRIDVSSSIGGDTLRSSLDDLSVMLDGIVDRFHCRTLSLSAFTASAFPITMAVFDLPAAPKPPVCDIPHTSGPMCRVYPASCKHAPQDEIDKCNRDYADLMAKFRARKDAVMALARQRLESFKDVKPAGRCTAVYESAAYGLAHAQYVIVVTDADSNCPWPESPNGGPKTVTVGPASRLVFLLVRGKNDLSGENALALSLKARRVFPDGVAMPLENALAPSFWSGMH